MGGRRDSPALPASASGTAGSVRLGLGCGMQARQVLEEMGGEGRCSRPLASELGRETGSSNVCQPSVKACAVGGGGVGGQRHAARWAVPAQHPPPASAQHPPSVLHYTPRTTIGGPLAALDHSVQQAQRPQQGQTRLQIAQARAALHSAVRSSHSQTPSQAAPRRFAHSPATLQAAFHAKPSTPRSAAPARLRQCRPSFRAPRLASATVRR